MKLVIKLITLLMKLKCAKDDKKLDSKGTIIEQMFVPVPAGQLNMDSTPSTVTVVYTALIAAVNNLSHDVPISAGSLGLI